MKPFAASVALIRALMLVGSLTFAYAAHGADDVVPPPQAQVLTTKTGVRFGIWPAKPQSPAPTLFLLANSIEGTLNDLYFRQSGNMLAKQGYLCVSVDLPCHGQERRKGEPAELVGWRRRCELGDDFVADVTKRCSAVLDELIATGLTDAEKIAVCGTSRGGFMGMHFAAADPRVKCVVAFGLLTDMTVLREFNGIERRELAQAARRSVHPAPR